MLSLEEQIERVASAAFDATNPVDWRSHVDFDKRGDRSPWHRGRWVGAAAAALVAVLLVGLVALVRDEPTTPAPVASTPDPSVGGGESSVPIDDSTPTSTVESPASSVPSSTANTDPSAGSNAGLRTVAPSPLAPRSSAMAVWTGAEVLVFGGEPRSVCPPGADCVAPDFAALADGAAYNPATDTWRTLSSAPLNFSGNARPVLVDGIMYVHVIDTSWRPNGEGGFLAYDIASDTWTERPTPGDGNFEITRYGDTVVAFRGTDEADPSSDLIYDPAEAAWEPFPDDPLSPSFDRTMIDVDGELFLFAKDLVANPGSEQPSLVRAAVFDSESVTWTIRADSEILSSENATAVGDEVIFAISGSADGGQVNNWGRSYSNGGVYDTRADRWAPLPEPAANDGFRIAGVLGDAASTAFAAAGNVLLTNDMRWVQTPFPAFSGDSIFNQAVAATDDSLFVFGGEQWAPGQAEATLSNDAQIWTPTP